MEKGWTKVGSYTDELTGQMNKLALEENDIVAVLINKQDSSFKFGKVELYVQDEQIGAAREIIGGENTESINED